MGIVGEPGAGKSRLLYEFRQALAGKQVTYLEGRCLSYGSAIPYVPVLEIIRQNFGVLEADTAEAVAAKVRSGIAEVGLDPDEWGPILLLFLGVKEGTERLSALTRPIPRTVGREQEDRRAAHEGRRCQCHSRQSAPRTRTCQVFRASPQFAALRCTLQRTLRCSMRRYLTSALT
jgi:predicted ATPase